MRVICHAQHLTGVGHFVRMHLIACGLASAHEVHLVDGGVPVPRPAAAVEPTRLPLPLLRRVDGTLVGADGSAAEPVLLQRARELAAAATAIRPDVVLLDHFPFSKWELSGEIVALIDAARTANPAVRVLCSLRDIAPRTRYEDVAGYEAGVVDRLEQRFDGILVHADPAFTRFEEHFPATVPVPVRYTGFVTEDVEPHVVDRDPYAVLSTGGVGGPAFVAAALAAARERLHMPLHEFGTGARFSAEFPALLAGAHLSISRAGYNTTAAILRSRVRAVVVPDPRLSDQGPRAARLAQHGLAAVVDGAAETDVDAIGTAIDAALAMPAPQHDFDVDGVAATRRLIEADSG